MKRIRDCCQGPLRAKPLKDRSRETGRNNIGSSGWAGLDAVTVIVSAAMRAHCANALMRAIPVLRKEVPYAEEEARAQTALDKSQT